MSPEGAVFGIEQYLSALKQQARVAQDFFFGRTFKGLQGLSLLPSDIQLRIDQIVWEMTEGGGINLEEEEGPKYMASAILLALEERMGLFDIPSEY